MTLSSRVSSLSVAYRSGGRDVPVVREVSLDVLPRADARPGRRVRQRQVDRRCDPARAPAARLAPVTGVRCGWTA